MMKININLAVYLGENNGMKFSYDPCECRTKRAGDRTLAE